MEYTSPGVYIKEIPVLPASVAQVATAIPAFVGYTEKAEDKGENLKMKPTRVTSLPEFREIFGEAPEPTGYDIQLDPQNRVTKVDVKPRYFLYDSIGLFYAGNKGSACYVVSVGTYQDDVKAESLLAGIEALRQFDEPTLILYPDGCRLKTAAELNKLHTATLTQCADLQDRFGIFDVLEDPASDDRQWLNAVNTFRDLIGVNNLKYGAAYTPWLKVSAKRKVAFELLNLKKNGVGIQVDQLTSNPNVLERIANIGFAQTDRTTVRNAIAALSGGADQSLRLQFDKLVRDFVLDAEDAGKFAALFQYMLEIGKTVDKWLTDNNKKVGNQNYQALNTKIQGIIDSSLKASITTLMAYHKGGTDLLADGGANLQIDLGVDAFDAFRADPGPWMIQAPDADSSIYKEDGAFPANDSDDAKRRRALPALSGLFVGFESAMNDIVDTSQSLVVDADRALQENFPVYKNIVAAAAERPALMPPSGAVVGAIAYVDRTFGVWKAPANVGLDALVVGLSRQINQQQQGGLNVDPNSGKSINAIRHFTGRGTLIWGARTLAGNDNEWRYVPVRRLFNMVEESIQKATAWVVFEPNDAGTWVRVKGMIDNFLTTLWRQGALAGAKPENAFFVNVGLGKTMTPTDILEGRLIIEVGIAAVRPAEFIVLKFMHKLQEAA